MSSRSTPLSQIRQQQPPAPVQQPEDDDNLVNEILREIDNNDNSNMQQNNQSQQMQQQMQQQQMQEQQMQEQQMQQQQMQQEQMNLMGQVNEQMFQQQPNLEQPANPESLQSNEQNQLLNQQLNNIKNNSELGYLDTLYSEFKSIIIVSVVCLLISLPQSNNILKKFLPNKEIIINNMEYALVLLKALLGGILYFLANKFA